MLLHPPGEVLAVSTVKMVGPIVQWASSLLLVGVFALLIPLGSQRRAVTVWTTAWVAQVVAMSWIAMTALFLIFAPRAPRPEWFRSVQQLYWPARFVFLAAVGLGALGAARRMVPIRTERFVLLLTALSGMVLAFANQNAIAARIELIATPVVFFGGAQVVLARATGRRLRGLLFLGCALTMFGTLSTLYLMANFEPASTSGFTAFARLVARSSGYGDALCLGLLAAAVIVVVVQESFLESAQAHAERLHLVATSETRLNGIIQAAREAIVTADDQDRIDLLNGAAATLFRVNPRDALGRSVQSFLPEASLALQANASAAESPLERADLTTHVGHGVRPDGSRFPVEFTVGRLPAGDRSGSVLVLRDLTARRAAEAEREAFDRHMAESEKMLAIGRVVSGVAHELNNPLAVVLGQSEQLVGAAPTGELRTGLRLIHEQAHRARAVVRDLQAFVRHRPHAPESVNLGPLAARTTASQLGAAMAHAVILLTDLPSSLPLVRIDRVAVEQILVNLIENGLDAAGPDGTVRVSAGVVDGRVELFVEDSGHGAPDEIADRLFEPFFTTKDPGQGTGLGLSVSRELAEQQGGTLRFENRPAAGIGARVTVSFPIASTQADGLIGKAKFPVPPVGADGTTAEVMLIDDEPAVRTTLGKMFTRAGWRVREAGGGSEALSWLLAVPDADAPAVILCDLKMPGLNGRDVYGQVVQRRPALARLFIFVTGDVVESLSNGFIADSGRDVVEKPFTIAEIGSAVERVLRLT
jgi:PAS domain S-box-containing protein